MLSTLLFCLLKAISIIKVFKFSVISLTNLGLKKANKEWTDDQVVVASIKDKRMCLTKEVTDLVKNAPKGFIIIQSSLIPVF